MLGPVQKQWLKQELKASTGVFKVIASPVPWSFESKGNSVDTWNGFRHEREEIFQFLSEQGIEGVILLSGDRHRSDVWRIEREGDYTLYEFESSRLTNEHVHEIRPQSVFGYNEKQSFGLLTFHTDREDPEAMFEIVSIDGEPVYKVTVKRSRLTCPDRTG
jgi:alkaline phosphatase D